MRIQMFVDALALVVFVAPIDAQSPAPQSQPALPTAQSLREEFDALVKSLAERTLDMGKDGLTEAAQRKAVIDLAVARLSESLHAAAVDERVFEGLARDAVTFRANVSPRLSGNVVRVGPNQPFKDLAAAQPGLRPGDLVLLDAGEYEMINVPPTMRDLAIVGQGADRTALIFGRDAQMNNPDCILIEDVRIDCKDNPICDNRSGSGICLRACEIGNYNSGAGGSNALYSNTGVVLLEECLFDGEKGSSAGPRSMGNALDLRADAWLYARRCQFVNNDEIERVTARAVFDGCTMLNTIDEGFGVMPYPTGVVWLRESDSVVEPSRRAGPNVHRFTLATDDLAFIEHVLDPDKPVDDDSRQLAQSLLLHRRLPYWIGLIRHENPRVRELTAGRLKQLVEVDVNLPNEQQKEGERLADLGVLFACEQEYTRLITWFESNRERLKWDEAAGRYRLEKEPAPVAEDAPAKEPGT
jgi:hypothetical protein